MSGYPKPSAYTNSSESVLARPGQAGDSTAYLEKPYSGAAAAGTAKSSKKKWWLIGGGVTLLLLAAAGGIAGGIIARNNAKDSSDKSGSIQNAANAANAATTITSKLPNGSMTTETASPAATSNAAKISVKALPQWSWTRSSLSSASENGLSSDGSTTQQPMLGLAIGNWLVLEQWMYESWFNSTAGNNASIVDEWNLMLHLGDSALSTMQQHWSSWFTEADVESAYQAGINHLRLPVGYWAFLDSSQSQGEPYLFNAGQLDYLQQALGWAYKRNMYAIIDLHGLPGSQNGEITSGHKTSNPTFFTDAQQTRADASVEAALTWITNSPYRSVISALELANEPRPYTSAQFDTLKGYYQRAYDKASTLSNPVPVQCHHGFPNQVPQVNMTVEAMWMSWFHGKDPALAQLIEHPYIGTFPLQNNAADMLNQVCTNLNRMAAWPVPVLVTEWSLRTGINTVSYEQQMYAQQAVAWAHVGGGNFWSHKAMNGSAANNGGNSIQWSFLDLIEKGSIPMPGAGQNVKAYLDGLTMNCQNVQSVSWANGGQSSKRHRRSYGQH